MKRYLKLVVFLFLLVIIPVHVYADECDFSTKAKLKKLASNINTSYTPKETDTGVTFDVIISNIYPGLVVTDMRTGIQYRYDAGREVPVEVAISGFEPDQTYQFEVSSDAEGCNNTVLNNYYVTLPAYNFYYKDALCIGIENYKLCNRWLKHSMSFEEFEKSVTEYRESLNQKEAIENKKTTSNPILQFIKDYYYVFIGLIVLGVGYVIYVRRKRDSFGF